MDCTINLDYDPGPDGRRYPPTVHPKPQDSARVRARWAELGLDKWGNPPVDPPVRL